MAVTLLEQRQIEANVLVPLIKAFQAEFGVERTNAIARQVITDIARQHGEAIAASQTEGNPIEKMASGLSRFSAGGALEVEEVNHSDNTYAFNITRCGYADFYKKMGVPELGFLLSCSRDFALTEGMSPDLQLTRTQTIMQGASHCDFRFRLKTAEKKT
ncbi:MAG: L-2-amino-thiazoline-4-carboxylic acid hydrolase [Candidatus Binatia bacterium]